jgi:hypothetical protein
MLLNEKWYSLIGKKLRDERKSAEESTPRRWVDLIRYLDKQERRTEREQGRERPKDRKH